MKKVGVVEEDSGFLGFRPLPEKENGQTLFEIKNVNQMEDPSNANQTGFHHL